MHGMAWLGSAAPSDDRLVIIIFIAESGHLTDGWFGVLDVFRFLFIRGCHVYGFFTHGAGGSWYFWTLLFLGFVSLLPFCTCSLLRLACCRGRLYVKVYKNLDCILGYLILMIVSP